jgi:hypothetical protein
MYRDLIRYELADGITVDHLTSVATDIISSWMGNLEGFLGWDIHDNGDGQFTDIVYWTTKRAAEDAEQAMQSIPNAADWYKCYKAGTIKAEKLECVLALGPK